MPLFLPTTPLVVYILQPTMVVALRRHCSGNPQQRGTKSKVVPNKGEQNQKWLPHPRLLGCPKEGGNATSPLHSRGSQQRGTKSKVFPNKKKQNQKWLPHPCLLGGPKEGRNATPPLHSRGPQQRGAKSEVAASPLPSWVPKRGWKCYVTVVFSGIPTKGNKIKSVPQQKETKSEVAASTLPSWGPKRGQKC